MILLCAAAAPALVVLALAAIRFGAGPTQMVPQWNDEIVYWNEIAAFAHAGFDAGYVTVNEETAPAAASRFGPHGPVFPMLYGLAARVAGWRPYSGFLLNLALVTVAAWGWLLVRAPDSWPAGRRLAGVAAEIAIPAIFWPLLLLLPMLMQEALHFAVAFALAAATWRLLDASEADATDDRARLAARTWLWAAPVLVVATLARPTWAVMVLPLGWAQARRPGAATGARLAAGAAAALLGAQQLFAYLSAPFPGSVAYVASGSGSWRDRVGALAGAFPDLAGRAAATVGPFLDRENGDPAEVVLRYVALAAVVGLAVIAVVAHRTSGSATRRTRGLQVAALALALPIALVIGSGYIEGFRDFRVLAPHLLYAVLIGAAVSPVVRAGWWLTLLAAPAFLQTFDDLHRERFTVGPAAIEAVAAALRPAVAHDPEQAGWGNTVLVHVGLLRYPLLGLPAGLSVSYAIDWDEQPLPPRSRYLLLREQDEAALTARVRLEPVATTPVGTLYRNLGAP